MSPIRTAGQVGELLGLHESQVRRWAAAGIIPHYKSGSHYIFHRAEGSRWCDDRQQQQGAPQRVEEVREPAITLSPGLGALPDLGKLLLDGEVELVVTVRRRARK